MECNFFFLVTRIKKINFLKPNIESKYQSEVFLNANGMGMSVYS